VVVGDHHHRPLPVRLLAQQFEDLRRVVLIEVAGWLIGEEQPRLVDQGAGDRHPLHLATAEVPRRGVELAAQPDLLEQRRRPLVRATAVHPGDRRRQLDVLAGAEAGEEVEELEDEAEIGGPEPGPLALAETADLAPVESQPPLARRVEGAEQVEQRALAAARGTDDRDQLARLDPHRDPVQHLDCPGAERIALADSVELQDRTVAPPVVGVACRPGHPANPTAVIDHIFNK
jgi:hypothetical protein